MFDQTVQRMGFCCKYMDPDQSQKPKVLKEIQQQYTEKSTTRLWCNNNPDKAEQKLFDCVEHNMASALNLVKYVGDLPKPRRMVRLGSNQIPMATEQLGATFGRMLETVNGWSKDLPKLVRWLVIVMCVLVFIPGSLPFLLVLMTTL